ncbi:hypothetical protein GUITHDRAFT_121584 [Guillardia theta CCMP2712]|uniref:Cyclin-like domain-containing protein n=1 Tax=Guillardia theta (strain CCMP2712) TaxID=905079 RepID=L1I7P7_GUITC|nr:hypothetical protein GUITHDRAFT_121584 [Guillardia theta CCMP2712]EKX32258.1 hypothetical protein GUITHDRAFT_121584 [Guillardia theta CCMP2712]|eukprot:XP_005819238.1 hypothetical protein GUITHDRAFT_121584 [Guillardia theta CCMP2712]
MMDVDNMPSLSLVADEPVNEGCCVSPLKRSMDDSVFDHLNYKRQRQTDIDDTSSDASTDRNEEDAYLDIVFLNKDLDYLKKIQRLNPEFDPHNKFVNYRYNTIHYMSGVCRSLALKSLTLHRAVNYLDRLMGSDDFPTSLHRLAASACVLVAAKFEEHPSKVPRVDQVMEMITGIGSKDQLLAAEKLLLQKLNWNASCATHLHFSHCFMHHGVSHHCDTRHGRPLSPENIIRITSLMERIATGVCLPDYSFVQHDQALVASAGLAAARSMVGVDEVWPRQLASRTGYSMEEIKVCVQQILLQQDRLCIPRFTSLDRDVLEKNLSSSPKCVALVSESWD